MERLPLLGIRILGSSALELPRTSGESRDAGASTLIMARSVDVSAPTTVAL